MRLPARTETGVRHLSEQAPVSPNAKPTIRFGVIGINHGHITAQARAILRAGGEFVAVYAREADLPAASTKQFPQARVAKDEREVLEDPSIQLVLSASIPDERAPLGIRVMQHGKDYMADKPGMPSTCAAGVRC